ncbi:hypothetical protein JCM8547_000276 [Rhodosporidiobolus lusitaniae]
MASALAGIRSSTADPYHRFSHRPPSRGPSYPLSSAAYGLSRAPSPASFPPPRPSSAGFVRAPSPARPTSVVYGARSPSPSPTYVAAGGMKAPSLTRRGSTASLTGGVRAGSPQGFYPSPGGSSRLTYPCSGAGKAASPGQSPFLLKAPLLDDLPPKLALTLAQLANSLESLSAQFPVHSSAVQQHRAWAESFFSWVKLLLPPFSAFLRAVAQLRDVSEDVWRAAGGYVAASSPSPVTVDVEQPDPEGGSHTVTGRERLSPVSGAALSRTVQKIRQNTGLWMEVEQAQNAATQRLLSEAERIITMLLPVERMAVQTAPRLPGGPVPRVSSQQHIKTLLHAVVQVASFPRQLTQLLAPLSSDPSIASTIFFHPSEATDVFRSYRRIDSTLSKASTQLQNAYDLMVENLQKAGYLPSNAMTGRGGDNGMRRAQTYPTLAEEGAYGGVPSRPSSAGGFRPGLPSRTSSGYGSSIMQPFDIGRMASEVDEIYQSKDPFSHANLRDISEDIWRAAGGCIAASSPSPVTVDVEQPDPEGGSHTVTARERLSPVSRAVLSRTVEKIRQNAALWMEIEQAENAATQRLLNEKERVIAMFMPLESMAVQTASRLPGAPVPICANLEDLSCDPPITSSSFFKPSEAIDVFQSYRRIDSTLCKTLTQLQNAYNIMLKRLTRAAYASARAISAEGGTAGPRGRTSSRTR